MRDANYHKELPWNCVFNRVKTLDSYDESDNPFCNVFLSSLSENQVLKISI
jgi:hypothetical protein